MFYFKDNVVNHTVEAVLHYREAEVEEPTSRRLECKKDKACVVLNCPFLYFPIAHYIKCLTFDDLRAKEAENIPVFVEGDSEEHFLNFHFAS